MIDEPDAPIAVDDYFDDPHFEVCLQCGLEAPPSEFSGFYCLECNYDDGFDG